MKRWLLSLLGAMVLVSGGLVACQGAGPQRVAASAVSSPTPNALGTVIAQQVTSTPTPVTPTRISPTPIPTNTPRSTQVTLHPITPTPSPGQLFDQSGEIRDHYWFARPFPRDPSGAIHDYASRSYPFGTTGGDQFATHHGLDFQNRFGTGVLAVARGQVFYAGPDSEVLFGPQPNFYGNVIVIEHEIPAPNGQPLYSLYGHLSRVNVETGQYVELQEKIGQVGSEGVALGAHLHLEVRIGDPYDYNSVYNPDLWIRPWPGYGTLAGRIYDRYGQRAYNTRIIIHPLDGSADRYTYAYADDTIKSDPYYGEHFTYGDLPAGEYQVIVRIKGVLRFKGQVTVEPGRTAWIEIRMN